MARERRLKKESADSSTYSSSGSKDIDSKSSSGSGNGSSNSNDRGKFKGHLSDSASGNEYSGMEQSIPMETQETENHNGYNSDTEEYFSAGEFERNQGVSLQGPDQMEVDTVTKRKRSKKRKGQKVKQLFKALSNLLD